MTVLQAPSQCLLVEMDSTTFLLISLFGIMSVLVLKFKSMEKPSVQLGANQIHRHSLMRSTPHAMRRHLLLRVNMDGILKIKKTCCLKKNKLLIVFTLTGDMVQVVYEQGTDTTPLYDDTASYYYNGFTGFRI